MVYSSQLTGPDHLQTFVSRQPSDAETYQAYRKTLPTYQSGLTTYSEHNGFMSAQQASVVGQQQRPPQL